MDRPGDSESIGHARRFAGNAAWLLIGDIFAKIAGFAFVVVVARGLGTSAFGYFNFAISFIPLFLRFGIWGLDEVAFREIARHRERVSEVFMSAFVPRFVLNLAAVVVAALAARWFVPGWHQWLAVVLIGVALLLDELANFVTVVFKAFERMKFRAQRILANRILTLILAFIAVLLGGNLLTIAATYALGSLGGTIYAFYVLRKHFPPIRPRDRRGVLSRDFLRQGAPIGIASVLNMAIFRLDATMLQGMQGPVAVAMYGIAYRFFESFLFVSWSLASVMLPRMSRAGPGRTTVRTFEIVLTAGLAFYLPLAAGAPFAGEWVLTNVFGDRYRPAIGAILFLIPAAACYGAVYITRMAAIAIGRRRPIMWLAMGALVFNVLGNVFAIPRWGFVGAAAVTLATGLAEAGILLRLFLQNNPRMNWLLLSLPFIAAGAMGIILLLAQLRDAAALAVGSAVYLTVLIILVYAVVPDEAQMLRGILKRRQTAA